VIGVVPEVTALRQKPRQFGKLICRRPHTRAVGPGSWFSRQGKVVEEFSALEATEEMIMYAAIL